MEKAFVSWSGGKDCCQAGYLAQLEGYEIRYLFNMINPGVQRSCSHGIATRWIQLQSEALQIPLIQQPTSGNDYEKVFVESLINLKKEGITVGIFGDIDFLPHLEWIQKVCDRAGIRPILPLWGKDQNAIMQNFIKAGFQSVVIATRADILDKEWLGRRIDDRFLADLAKLKQVTPCGEAGEYHTLVINGPFFKKRLEIQEYQVVRRQEHWFMDIQKCILRDKEQR